MFISPSTKIPNQKTSENTLISAVYNTVNKLTLDRKSCEYRDRAGRGMVIMFISPSTKIPNQKTSENTLISAVHNTVNKLKLDRKSCEKLEKN